MTINASIRSLRLPILGTALFMSFAAVHPGLAQVASPSVDANSVIATVGDETITEGDLAYAAEDFAEELGRMPPAQQRSFLASVLIDMRIMAKAARDAELQNSDVFKRRLKYLEDRSLRRAYFAEKVVTKVTPEAVKAKYDAIFADFKPQEELRARHILVSSQEDILAIKAEIEAGKSFEAAAQEHSSDGSAQNGGDLGYFGPGQMVGPFEDAAYALKVGEVSAPVQSEFGWHLIKLEDRRDSVAPSLEQVEPQVRQQVMIDAFNAEVKALKDATKVVVNDPAIAEAIAAEEAAQAEAEARK
jgi:peptidyl-prolyl cis-trans isomerase C